MYNTMGRTAGKGQPGLGNCGRTAMTEYPDSTAWTIHPGQDAGAIHPEQDVGTGQITRTRQPERSVRTGHPGQERESRMAIM
jgi:hypothetical protein